MWRALTIQFVILLLTSCYIDDGMNECNYNVLLGFSYNLNPSQEAFERISSQDHLLFRNDTLVGTLYVNGEQQATGLFEGLPRQSLTQLKMTLPEGSYNLTTWSNYDPAKSQFTQLVVGSTLRQDIVLRHTNVQTFATQSPGFLSNCERLYFSSCDFEVGRDEVVVKSVDMLCAHTQLVFVIRWRNASENPNISDPIYLRLEGIHAGYLQKVSHPLEMSAAGVPAGGKRKIVQQVPCSAGEMSVVQVPAIVKTHNEITTTFVTYRLWDNDDHHPILSIWGGKDGQTRLMKDIDLRRFFETNGWKLTNNILQYFNILLVIDGNQVEATPLENTGWIDGGSFGVKP